MALEAFRERVLSDLLPAFCNDVARNYDIAGFKSNFQDIHDADAEAFLRGLDAGLVQLDGNMYRAPRGCAREQFFWEGSKRTIPRPISIWIEPIITIATLAKLHFELGWPKNLLGTQSRDWAFDVIAFLPSDSLNEHIACEVKKTDRELSSLIRWMREFGEPTPREAVSHSERNAYRKVVGLRARRAPLFWAAGPGGTGMVFNVSYGNDGGVTFEEAPLATLQYPGHART